MAFNSFSDSFRLHLAHLESDYCRLEAENLGLRSLLAENCSHDAISDVEEAFVSEHATCDVEATMPVQVFQRDGIHQMMPAPPLVHYLPIRHHLIWFLINLLEVQARVLLVRTTTELQARVQLGKASETSTLAHTCRRIFHHQEGQAQHLWKGRKAHSLQHHLHQRCSGNSISLEETSLRITNRRVLLITSPSLIVQGGE